MDHDTVVEEWRRSGQQYDDENYEEGFTFRTMGVANNALTCPAVFWIVEGMKKRGVARRRKGRRRRRL